MKSRFRLEIVLILILAVASCAPRTTVAQPTASSAAPTDVLATVRPTNTALPTSTSTSAPTATNAPTAAPEPAEPLMYVNPQRYAVEYSITIRNKGFSPTDIHLYLPIPGEWDAQADLQIDAISPEPQSQEADEMSGNSMAYWQLKGVPKKDASEIFLLPFELTAYETNTHIDPAAVQAYKTETADYQRYTGAEKYIESSDPKVIQLAEQIAGQEINPYLLAHKFYEYIIDTYQYKLLGQGLNGAKYLLDHGNGECGDYSALFIAMSRAKGIPARPVVGYWAISGNNQTHVWAEFYLEGIGWIPVDATIGQQSTTKRAYYFGNMDNQRVILSKGYNTALIPAGPGGFVAPILQAPLWWFWGSGDANALQMDRNWKVSQQK